jgi:predicted dehydrogenase
MKPHTLTRRHFLRNASLASAVSVAFPAVLRSQGATGASPNNRLNVACFGVGNQGRVAVEAMVGENLVAFCDVDDQCAAQTYGKHSGVPRFRDFRKVFDAFGNQIDAVTISTPDHMHYPIAMAALSLGKHVFVEKPMTHTIWESRRLRELAAEKGVATQMGNQGHALEGIRLLKEWFDAGVLGEVREVQSWTDRPIWPQGVRAPDHSKMIPVVPSSLDWDLWLGVAAQRAYDPAYVPFNWRGYWDFGTGAAGDMGCHLMDGAFYALQLDAPEWVEAISAKANTYSAPSASVVTYQFPARSSLPPVRYTWYDGGLKPLPPPEFEHDRTLPSNGSFIIGSKASVLTDTYYRSVRLIPETKRVAMMPTLPPPTLPRVEGGHFQEWLRACKGGPAPGSSFEYAARLTEMVLLSNLALRAGRRIEWDAPHMKVTNIPEANQWVTKEYRPGFGV